MNIRFERHIEWMEKWVECKAEDIFSIDFAVFVDNKEMDIGRFIKMLMDNQKEEEDEIYSQGD